MHHLVETFINSVLHYKIDNNTRIVSICMSSSIRIKMVKNGSLRKPIVIDKLLEEIDRFSGYTCSIRIIKINLVKTKVLGVAIAPL